MSRILFISPFFYPEPISTGKYNTYLVKALAAKGAKVHVVASHPLYPDWRPTRSDDSLPRVTIHRGGLQIRYPSSAVLRRILLELWFALHSLIVTWKLRKELDVCVAVFPPVAFVFLVRMVLPKRVKIVGVIHDLQGVMAESIKSRFRSLIASALGKVESLAFQVCDRLICLSESMKTAVTEVYGVDAEKCVVHYPFATAHETALNKDNLSDQFPVGFVHIVYSGALGEKQRPENLLRLFEKMCEARDDLMCHLFSRGPMFEKIKVDAANRNVPRVVFQELVQEEWLEELYERSTVQVIPQAEGTGAGAFPSKLPNLLQAGVPVFAICDVNSELADVLERVCVGKAAHTWDEDELVVSLCALLDEIADGNHKQRRAGLRTFIEQHFSVDRVVESISNI